MLESHGCPRICLTLDPRQNLKKYYDNGGSHRDLIGNDAADILAKAGGSDAHSYIDFEGCSYMEVFTDGSTMHPKSFWLAHSGYGLYFGPNHPHNMSAKLCGVVQNTFRAELRAICEV